jgi:lipopolysaccharide/colanic/teichoic acid biosynthesis glycosyltransferase
VGGRSDASYATRVRLDVEYARTPSLWRDMSILLQTPKLIFLGKGAS